MKFESRETLYIGLVRLLSSGQFRQFRFHVRSPKEGENKGLERGGGTSLGIDCMNNGGEKGFVGRSQTKT